MKIARTKNAINSIAVGMLLRVYQTIVPFLMRTAMIQFMGVQYLGLNSLFTSVLQVLNLAELGVGSAMVFSMYKPIAEDDEATICALMKLYRRYYRLIGLFIGAVGLALTPAVPHLISSDIPPELNVYVLYLLNLGATVLTYWLFAYKNCLLQAHQRTDLSNLALIVSYTVQFIAQFVIVLHYHNYYAYVMVTLLSNAFNNVLTAAIATKKFPRYRPQGNLPREKVREINGKIRDLFTSKLGSVVLKASDTLVISAFLGLTVLAVYQNYFFILTSVLAFVEILLKSIIAGLGNSLITETPEKNRRDLEGFTFMFLWVAGVCTCCFLGLYQPFMEIWVGRELMLGYAEVLCFSLYFFEFALYRLINVYKDAAGLWRVDRLRPLVTAIVNLGLNLMFVRSLGVVGIMMSTIVSQVAVGYPWLLRNLFNHCFAREALPGYCKLILRHTAATAVAGVAAYMLCSLIGGSLWTRLLVCLPVCALVPNVIFLALFGRSENFGFTLRFAKRILRRR